MFKLAAAALLFALVFTALTWRRGRPRWLRYALASFGFFGVITATFWILSPDGTAHTVSASASGALMLRIVQGRGVIVLPFGLLSLVAAWRWPERRVAAMLGPLVYNSLMVIEATRAQFTPLATPERWTYVTLHAAWAVSLFVYCRRSGLRLGGQRALGVAAAAVPAAIGATLYLAPQLLIGAGQRDPLLLHSAHAFGASLVGLAAVILSRWIATSAMRPSAP